MKPEYMCPICHNILDKGFCESCGYENDQDEYFEDDGSWIHDPDMGDRS